MPEINDDLFEGCFEENPISTQPPEPENEPGMEPDAENGHSALEMQPDFDTLAVGEQIAKDTVVLELHVHRAGVFRKIPSENVIEARTADCQTCNGSGIENGDECIVCDGSGKRTVKPDAFKTQKTILDTDDFQKITNRINALKKFRKAHSVPASMLANGFYILPRKFIEAMDEEIESARNDINQILDEMEPRWIEMTERKKQDLGDQWKASDYPQFHVWRKEWQIVSKLRGMNVPAILAKENKRIWDRENAKLKMEWADTAQEIRDALRAGFTHLVTDFSGKLGRDDDGKYKSFTKNLVEKLQEFCATFEARDLTGDEQLSMLASQAKQLVQGVDPKALRTDEALRDALEKGFLNIAAEAAKLVVTRERTVALEDEDL